MSELLELKVDRPKLTQVSTWYIIRVNLKKKPQKKPKQTPEASLPHASVSI